MRRSPRKSGPSNNRAQTEHLEEKQQLETEDENDDGQEEDGELEAAGTSEGDFEQEENFKGDEFLDKSGQYLKEESKVHIKTFTLSKRSPDRRYMLVLDLARSMGYADSFRFMKTYPQLPRVNIEPDEREELIEQGVVHPIMKFRNVPVVSVIGAYLIFGQKLFEQPKEWVPLQQQNQSTGSLIDNYGDDVDDEFDLMRKSRVIKEQANLDLKEPGPVLRDNGDWIYRSALAAAKFNAHLRAERFDRLWGDEEIADEYSSRAIKRKSLKEESDEDAFDLDDALSEDAGSSVAADSSIVASKRRQYRKKLGFYDVHTNINQIPANTQIENVKVELYPLGFQDLRQKKLLHDPNAKPIEIDILNSKSLPPVSVDPASSLATWLGPKYIPKHDPACYPVALIPGQFQGVYSMYTY